LSVYDSVRAAWRINKERARDFHLVLAHREGIVVGAFRPDRWLDVTRDRFPWLRQEFPGRCGFEGQPAADVESLYLDKRVPDEYRKKGAANPIRFVELLVSRGE
jgi:uncharacterized protein